MKKLLFLSLLFLSPSHSFAGFPESEKGLDIEKIENAFRLPCDEIGSDNCIARSLGISGCTWMFQVRDGKKSKDALNISDEVFVALMKGFDNYPGGHMHEFDARGETLPIGHGWHVQFPRPPAIALYVFGTQG